MHMLCIKSTSFNLYKNIVLDLAPIYIDIRAFYFICACMHVITLSVETNCPVFYLNESIIILK